MRILHLANGRLYGGVERMLTTLAESQAVAPDLVSEFAVCHEGRLERELRARNVAVESFGNVRLSQPVTLFQARRALRALVAQREYAAVICHAPWTYALFGRSVRKRGVPLVLWQHDRATGGTLIERATRRIPASLVLCNSHWTASFTDLLQPGVQRRVVYCPVILPRAVAGASRLSIRAARGASDREVVIVAASRIEPWKGQLQLLEALATVADRPWQLWIAGAPQRPHEARYFEMLQAAADALGIAERVRFLGECYDIASLLSAADVLAQANIEPEPFGIIFAESLLAGRPVVTSRMGGAPEIVDETCGRLVEPRDCAALARALAELIDDGAARATLGAAGPAHAAARCDPAVVLPALASALVEMRAV